jgi:hypothetical protein
MPTSSPPWPDLPLDLLLGIADRLHVPTDYVRFHAVCKPWRDAIPPAHCRPAFLPWLVAPRDAAGHCKVRCVFSSKSSSPHRTAGSEVRVLDRRWVISTDDGTATCWLLTPSTAAQSACAAVDPLTWSAAAMPVPRFPDVVKRWEESAVGLCYGDGTTVLYAYGLIHGWYLIANGFDVAIRQPGDDAEWRLVRRNSIHVHDDDRRRCCLAYHDGKIVLCVEDKRLIEPATPADASIDNHAWRSRPSELGKVSLSSHLVESRGELLWAFVQLDRCYYIDRRGDVGTINDLASSPSVSVYALAEKEEGGEEVEWVKRDGWSMADRVMFLGRPAGSFAVDAARFGMSDGRGCAYFVDRGEVYGGLWSKSLVTRSRVFKYSFLEDTTELLEQLPEEWTDVGCTWITPQISIAPTEVS